MSSSESRLLLVIAALGSALFAAPDISSAAAGPTGAAQLANPGGIACRAALERPELPAAITPGTQPLRPPTGSRLGAIDPFAAAQAGVDWLLPALCAWMQAPGNVGTDCSTGATTTCLGCHVQGESVFALARSSARCYRLPVTDCGPDDFSPVEFAARFVAGAQRKDCILGPTRGWPNCSGSDPNTLDGFPAELGSIGEIPGCGSKNRDFKFIQSAHGGLALSGYTSGVHPAYSSNLVALANWLVTSQQAGGNWPIDHTADPVNQGEALVTGAAAISLNSAADFASAAEKAAHQNALAAAATWLSATPLTTNQDKAFALVGLLAAGLPASHPRVDEIRLDLLDDALADGGWAERSGLESNAFATGQAVWALHDSGMTLDHPTLCAGTSWLIAAQDADGSWAMGTAGVNTDSPTGSRFTATSWPVVALGSIRRFGVAVDSHPPADICAATYGWDVMVRNIADDPCGLFPRSDTIDLTIANDRGDQVEVVPASLTLPAGGSALVRINWSRTVSPLGTPSTTTLTASSQGASTSECLVTIQADFVVASTDLLPGDLGNTLMAVRRVDDVVLSWGSDPVARSYVLRRSDTKGIWPGPPLVGGLPTADASVADVRTPPALLLYRVAGESCSGREGF